jgi:hypothetical protein
MVFGLSGDCLGADGGRSGASPRFAPPSNSASAS